MLIQLKVQDLALVAAAEVRFGQGLNLLTGETGSGKSLIVDALGLSMGARASTDQVRHGARRALVESVFMVDGRTLTLDPKTRAIRNDKEATALWGREYQKEWEPKV